MKTHQHYKVPGGETITKRWHPESRDDAWWLVAATIASDAPFDAAKKLKLSVRADGSLCGVEVNLDYIEVHRDENGIDFEPPGGAWSFRLSLAVAAALDKYAGSKLLPS